MLRPERSEARSLSACASRTEDSLMAASPYPRLYDARYGEEVATMSGRPTDSGGME